MREKKVVEIKTFNNFDENNNVKTKMFYNYLPNSSLNNSKGIVNATFPKNRTNKTEKPLKIAETGITSVEGIAFFKQYFPLSESITNRLLVYGNNKKVYINQMLDDTYDLFWLYELEFNSAPITLSFKQDDQDTIILASADKMVVWKTLYSPYTIEDVPIITSMCMNDGVLFCTIKEPAFKVWYATDLNAENVGNISKNSGYISLEDELGYARKIVTFNEDVYVFRDYGISKINYIKKEISVSQIYLSNTKIYTNTVCVVGNSILFMTKDGLYSFNGVKVSKTKVDFLNSLTVENNGAVASSLGEKYYLALKLNFDDDKQVLCEQGDYVNNVVIAVDTINFGYEIIRGVDVKTLLPVKTEMFEKMLVVFNSQHKNIIGEIVDVPKCVEENLPKFWLGENIVDTTNTKLFTKLSVMADAGVKFSVLYDDKTMEFTTYKNGLNEFTFKICCKEIKMEISSENESAVVNKVSLEYYEY